MDKKIFLEATIFPYLDSNHWCIWIEVDFKEEPINRSFHFKRFWLEAPNFVEKANGWWNKIFVKGKNKMHPFHLKLKDMKEKKLWSWGEFGNIFAENSKLEAQIYDIQQHMILEG